MAKNQSVSNHMKRRVQEVIKEKLDLFDEMDAPNEFQAKLLADYFFNLMHSGDVDWGEEPETKRESIPSPMAPGANIMIDPRVLMPSRKA